MKIISHTTPEYAARRERLGPDGMYNGAYYYSTEIVKNIIPRVKTDRPWVTVNVPPNSETEKGLCLDHAIFFAHKNTNFERYKWLKDYKDLIIVCSTKPTEIAMRTYGKTIMLPLSIDVDYVSRFKQEKKTRRYCYCGNVWSFKVKDLRSFLPPGCDVITKVPRSVMLEEMARTETVYAVGRCAIEAKLLGCKIGVCDRRYPDPDVWRVLDNKDAAVMLQAALDRIEANDSAVI